MFLFPYGHVQIKTKLNKQAAEQLLIEHLEPRKFLYNVFRGNHKFFEGESNNGRFKINRVVNSTFAAP